MTGAKNSMSFPDAGVIYVATRWLNFLIEARESIESLRDKVKDVHVTVITDISQAKFFLGSMADNIIVVPASELSSHTKAGWTNKTKCLGNSPYSKTIFLDTDTRIMSDRFATLIDVLEDTDVAMVAVGPNRSLAARFLQKKIFNTGMMAFRNTPVMKTLFSSWRDLQTAYLDSIVAGSVEIHSPVAHIEDMEMKKWLLSNDQTSLAELLSPDTNVFGARLKTLDPIWNFKKNKIPPGMDVVIHHADCYKVTPEAAKQFLRQRFGKMDRPSHKGDG